MPPPALRSYRRLSSGVQLLCVCWDPNPVPSDCTAAISLALAFLIFDIFLCKQSWSLTCLRPVTFEGFNVRPQRNYVQKRSIYQEGKKIFSEYLAQLLPIPLVFASFLADFHPSKRSIWFVPHSPLQKSPSQASQIVSTDL